MKQLSLRRAKPGPARIMGLELLHRYRMVWGFQALRGLKIARITSDLVRNRSSFEATAEEWRFQDLMRTAQRYRDPETSLH